MNKLLIGLLLGIGLIFSQTINAQYDNAIKIGSPGLSYERAIGAKSSINVSVGTDLFIGMVSTFGGEPEAELSDRTVTINDWKYGGLALEAQYRFYLQADKNTLQGFYVAPYVNYKSGKFKDMEGTDELGNTYDAEFAFNRFGGGVLIGTQWLLGANERFVLDFNFFGLGISAYKMDGDYTSDDEGLDFETQKTDIEDFFEEDAFFIAPNHEVTTKENGLDVVLDGIAPALRFNLSLGFAF